MLPTLIGAGVPAMIGRGEVVSSFSSAVNILHDQGLLISFVEEPRTMTFLSVCVPAFFRKKKRLVPGDRVRFDGHRLVTENFIIDLIGRPLWEGTLTQKDVKGFCGEKVSLVKEALLLKGREGGFLGLLRRDETRNPFADKAAKALSGIRSAPSRERRFKVLSGLAGLGPGSTPSGDDFIAGVLLGEEVLRLLLPTEAKAVAGSQDTMVPWPVNKEDLRLAMERTNDAGKTLLWQAFQGRFPSYLIEAVRSFSDAEGEQEIEDAVEKSVGRGATSGTDALVGFFFSVEGRI